MIPKPKRSRTVIKASCLIQLLQRYIHSLYDKGFNLVFYPHLNIDRHTYKHIWLTQEFVQSSVFVTHNVQMKRHRKQCLVYSKMLYLHECGYWRSINVYHCSDGSCTWFFLFLHSWKSLVMVYRSRKDCCILSPI